MQRTVLVADDDPDVTQALAMRLKQLGLSVMRSPDATHALVGVQRMHPDLLILDVNMPGGNGLAVAEMLASDTEFRNMPVIVHTGRDDQLTRIRCTDRCHYYVQKSPTSWEQIKAIVCKVFDLPTDSPSAEDATSDRALLAPAVGSTESDGQAVTVETKPAVPRDGDDAPPLAREDLRSRDAAQQPARAKAVPKPTRVLCIDDDPDISKLLKIRLAEYNVEVLRAFNGMHGYWTAIGDRPDAIICDMCMPEGDGTYIVSRLKSHPLTQNVPVIVLSGQTNPALKRTMLAMGVEAYLCKPLDFEKLLNLLRAHITIPAQPIKRQCMHDSGSSIPHADSLVEVP